MKKAQVTCITQALQCGGEGGIRTRGGLLTHTRFPGVRLKPLIHLSCKPHIITQDGLPAEELRDGEPVESEVHLANPTDESRC